MGHGDHGAGVVLERALQPGHRLGVQVVGGLIEEEEVRRGEEQPAQRHPAPLPNRKSRHIGVSGWQAQGIYGDLERPLQLLGAGGVDHLLQVGLLSQEGVDVGVGVTEGGADLGEAVEQPLDLADTVGHVPSHVLGGVQLRFLGQVARGESRREPGLAREAIVLARHDLEQ